VSTPLTFEQNVLIELFKGQYYTNETWIYISSSLCAACIEVQIYCTLHITKHITIIVKITGNKNEYTLSEHVKTVSKVSIFYKGTIAI